VGDYKTMDSKNLQLKITSKVLHGVKSAVHNSKEERCGFLFGYDDVDCRRITDFMNVENVAPHAKEKTFQISPEDYIKAERFAEKNHFELLGVYHSHPNCPAVPSAYDLEAAQPFFSYMILSTMDGSVDAIRSWRLNMASEFEEEFFN
jgi:proteasome lid subunit RPN8/RPN11